MAQAGGGVGDVFAQHAVAVARELYGEPNKKLSKPDNPRFGTNGSMSVDAKTGQFYDHENKEGGGVLWAISKATGVAVEGGGAVEWLREHGFYIPDERDGALQQRKGGGGGSKGGTRAPDRFDSKGNWLPAQVPDNGELVAVYPYVDATGKLLYEVCRFEWPDLDNPKGHSKTFLQRQPGRAPGRYQWNIRGITPVPYRLPEVLEDVKEGNTVFVVEGEKKVDMLRAIGVPATCNAGGANKFTESIAEALKGAKVVIIPDNDDAGRDHAKTTGNALTGLAASIRVLALPGVPEKGSVDDWLPAGGTIEKLYDLAEGAEVFVGGEYVSRFGAVTWPHIDDPGPEYEYVIKGVLTRGELSMLIGESQSGKSFVGVDIGLSCSRGVSWNKRKSRQGLVIYQAGESARGVRRKRLPAYRQHYGIANDPIPFVLLQNPLDLYNSDEDTIAFIDECKHWSRLYPEHRLEMIVIDTFNKATPGANENDGKDVGIVLARCDQIRVATGAHVMLVHHLNAGGTKARGHTSLFANVDNVLLCRVKDDHHDADNRQVREIVLVKQKDGEDGLTFPFVLPQVVIGIDADNEPITSCIVAPPSGVSGAPLPGSRGVTVGGHSAAVLKVIYDTVTSYGIFAPAEMELPDKTMVVTRRQIGDALAKVNLLENADETVAENDPDGVRRLADTRRKAFARARELLFTKGIIGMKDDYVWLMGRNVIGFPPPPGTARAAGWRRKANDSGAEAPFAQPDDVNSAAQKALSEMDEEMF